jgi:hypothetical protein
VVAVFGLLPAILGATLQEIIDLVTILNALRALGGKANVVRLVAQVATVPPTTLPRV